MHGKIKRSLRRANHKQGASLPWFELKRKKLEAWSVLLISQPCLSLPDGECLFGSRGGWRGVMNLKPKLLVQELITSGYKKDEAKRSRFEV
ncbi:hypothetical protein YC2023_108737 [Brassica napus]